MSERFDGLNLPQLLELMHEIVVPEPVGLDPADAGMVGVPRLAAGSDRRS